MKKFVYFFAAFMVLLVIFGVAVQRYINFNNYKPLIEHEISKYIDRKITIDGDIKLSILPVPSLNIYNVRLASITGAIQPDMLSFRKLKINVNLLPLISSKIEVSHILISQPTVTFEQLKNGKKNWDIAINNKPAQGVTRHDDDAKPNVVSAPMNFSVDTLEIVGGKIVYLTPSGQQTIDDLTATLTSDSLAGPFKLNGFLKLADQDIRFQLKIKQIADSIPIKLKLDLDSTDLNLDGIWVQSAMQFQGNIDSKSNAKSLEATIQKLLPAFHFPDFVTGPLSVNGHIVASENSLNIDNLKIGIDQETLSGRIDTVFKPQSVSCAFNGAPGNTTFTLNVKAQGSDQAGQLQLNTQSNRKLMKWLALSDFANMPDVLTGMTSFKTDFNINNQYMKFDNAELKIKDLTVKGKIDNNLTEDSYHYTINADGLMPVAQFLQIPVHNDPGTVATSGRLTINKGMIIYDNISEIAGIKINSSGKIELGKLIHADIKLAVKSVDTRTLFKTLSLDTVPVESFGMTSNIIYDNKNLNLNNLNITINASGLPLNLSGFVHTQLDNRHLIDAEIKIDSLKLDHFIPSHTVNDNESSSPKAILRRGVAPVVKTEPNPNPQVGSVSAEQWSKLPINLSFLNNFDGKFKINFGQITRGDLVFENFAMTALLTKGVLDAPNMTADFFDGKLQGSLNLDVTSDPKWSTQASIVDANVQRLIPMSGKVKIIKGMLNTKSNFNSTGQSLYDWIANLQGRLHLDISQGVVSGFDLKALSSKLKNISNPGSLIELFTNMMTTGKTNFSQCTVALDFAKGIGTFQTLSLLADGGRGSGSGRIDLPHYQLDLTGSLQLTEFTNLPPFTIRLMGPIDNPNKSFDTGDLEKFYINGVFSKLKNLDKGSLKNAGDIVGGLLGVKGPANTDAQPTQKDGSKTSTDDKSSSIGDIVSKPNEVIGNALKNLF